MKDFHDDQVAVSVGSSFSGYPNASFSNLDSWSIGFACNCLVKHSSNDTKTLNRYSLTAPFDLLDKLPAGNPAQGLQYSVPQGRRLLGDLRSRHPGAHKDRELVEPINRALALLAILILLPLSLGAQQQIQPGRPARNSSSWTR